MFAVPAGSPAILDFQGFRLLGQRGVHVAGDAIGTD